MYKKYCPISWLNQVDLPGTETVLMILLSSLTYVYEHTEHNFLNFRNMQIM
jgi:hypothetical protein